MADGKEIGPATADLRRDLEAILLASGGPLPIELMLRALSLPESELGTVEALLNDLALEFPPAGPRGFVLRRIGGGWVLQTNPASAEALAGLFKLPDDSARLSNAAMECLTIVAYLQPVTRPQIAEVRGVNSDSPVHTLLDRELITEVGRSQAPGNPVLYGTTRRFEIMFGLNGLSELPPIDEFALTEAEKENLRTRLGLLSAPD